MGLAMGELSGVWYFESRKNQPRFIIPILCQLLLQAQQAFFIPGLHQFMNQGSGREEADGEPLLAGRQTETEGDMGLAGIVKLTDCNLFLAFLHEAKPLKLRKAAIDDFPRFRSESG